MSDEFTTSAFIPALPMAVYMAWLDGTKHGEMTGADAHCDATKGGAFDAWDGYIHGTTTELDPGRRIVQRWRTAEFPGDAPDSLIEITLAPEGNGTRLKIRHSGIPEGQGKLYESGWLDHYFRPMQEYFIHAGISGVPHGASVTEILHRVSTGQASPSSPSLPSFREPSDRAPAADEDAPVEIVDASPPVSSGEFDLADENEQDDFDTEVASEPADVAEPKTITQDFWKHLDTPAGTAKPASKPASKPAPAPSHAPGRRPARREAVGAGRASGSGRRAGLKKAARPGKPAKAAKPKAATKKKKPAKAKNKSPKRKRGVVKKAKPAKKSKPAKKPRRK